MYSSTIGKNKKPVCIRMALHYHQINISDSTQNDRYTKNKAKSSFDKISHPLNNADSTNSLRYILERYNSLSWLTADPTSKGTRRSCLPVHVCSLLKMYRSIELLSIIDWSLFSLIFSQFFCFWIFSHMFLLLFSDKERWAKNPSRK